MVGLVAGLALRPLVKGIADPLRARSGQGDADVREGLAALEERMDDLRDGLERLPQARTLRRKAPSMAGTRG